MINGFGRKCMGCVLWSVKSGCYVTEVAQAKTKYKTKTPADALLCFIQHYRSKPS